MSKVQASYLHDGYKPSRGLAGWYRDLTVKEAKSPGLWKKALFALDWTGKVREIRLNGATKTWKRSPGCVLSLKYGLREYFCAGNKNRQEDEAIGSSVRVLVMVGKNFAADTPPGIVLDWLKENEGI